MKKYYLFSLLVLFMPFSVFAENPIFKGVVEALEIVNTYTLSQFANMDCGQAFGRCNCKIGLDVKENETPSFREYGSTRIDAEFRPNISSGNIKIDWLYTYDSGTVLPVATTTPFESEQKCRREVNEWIGKEGKEFQFAQLFYRIRK